MNTGGTAEPLAGASVAIVPNFVRATGEVRARFGRKGDATFALDTYESGGLRLRFPKVAHGCEAVIINTGGGMAGGDRTRLHFAAAAHTDVTLTTQSAEKVYHSQGPKSEVELRLELGHAARLDWLPQETILFDRARLARRLEAYVAGDASLTLAESVVFGRLAMGETRIFGSFRDRWRVFRDGLLVFAEDVRLEDDIAGILDQPVTAGGGRMAATLLHIAPAAEEKLDLIRTFLVEDLNGDPDALEAGASAWNGMLVARILSRSPLRVRRALARLMAALRGRPAPRVWQ